MSYAINEVIHASTRVKLYRATRSNDGQPVVIKVLDMQHSPQHLERLKTEYEIGSALAVSTVVKPLALETYQGMPALVMEDFGGVPLDRRLNAPMEVEEFLRLAVSIATAVMDIHQRNIVHKDLKPDNILVHPETDEVKIADFGIAAQLSGAGQTAGSAKLIEGSLPYMSPEQTGRTNRVLDQRSDLYSLGVTFYKMLTNRLPFQAADPIEWVHCHV